MSMEVVYFFELMCKIWAKTRPLCVKFRPFLNTMTNIGSTKFDYKSVDCVLGIRIQDHRW